MPHPPRSFPLINSQGACKFCEGTGIVRVVDESTLVPDESLSIEEGAVLPWQTLMWSLMKDIAHEMGVRTNVPFKELTQKERDIVFHGPAEKKHIIYQNKTSGAAGDMDFTYFNAIYTVENALSKVKDEKGMKRVEKFLKQRICQRCRGTRLSDEARAPRLRKISLADACQMPLADLTRWVQDVPSSLPEAMRPMAESICESFFIVARRLLELGLGYLTLDRASSTLSTGERQRMQLARAVRNRTTGVMYILDEPSIGLHPHNIAGLNSVMHDLVADGNSVILVDHDAQILSEAGWLIEMGPGAGAKGGTVVAEGAIPEIIQNPNSKIASFLVRHETVSGKKITDAELFARGELKMQTKAIHTVKPLDVRIPIGKMTVVTGVSGSGKTTMILESLVPGLEALISGEKLPEHVVSINAEGIRHIKLIDASPIGVNVRSTVATYADIHDELRKRYARLPAAREHGYKAGDFSYNTGVLRCPVCDGTGQIDLDIQFLPDVHITCTQCGGSRYDKAAECVRWTNKAGDSYSLPQMMDMDVSTALNVCRELKTVAAKLQILCDLGLGYLTLGEETPSLSGGEAQRLKLASEMGSTQTDSVFVFDEPTIGLHPLDIQTLLAVFRTLMQNGATVIVIEHDLDVIRHADYIVDMGPGGGEYGGRIIASGTPRQIKECSESITGQYL